MNLTIVLALDSAKCPFVMRRVDPSPEEGYAVTCSGFFRDIHVLLPWQFSDRIFHWYAHLASTKSQCTAYNEGPFLLPSPIYPRATPYSTSTHRCEIWQPVVGIQIFALKLNFVHDVTSLEGSVVRLVILFWYKHLCTPAMLLKPCKI